jgi:hypothetical protein
VGQLTIDAHLYVQATLSMETGKGGPAATTGSLDPGRGHPVVQQQADAPEPPGAPPPATAL